MVAYCQRRYLCCMTHFYSDFSGREQKLGFRFVDKRYRTAAGRHISVNLDALTNVRLTVLRVRKMSCKKSYPTFPGFQFLAKGEALHVDRETLVSHPVEKDEWLALWKRRLLLKWRFALVKRCGRLSMFSPLGTPSPTVAILGSAYRGSSGHPSAKYGCAQH